ncbi:MAG: hypothetical protein RMJ43_10970 [Chloroherpetonaceae bacterium]|nr:hypothetical protein [Chthonomonadaceae bacterium]MDW8208350.1 hypothetical protein [Chloroherpetonaceae bacterium]
MAVMASAMDLFPDVETPETLVLQTPEWARVMQSLSANAHVHLPPNFSAFDSVEQAVQQAASEQIDVLGASNYYDYAVYHDFAARARAARIVPLFGIEIIALLEDLQRAGVRINDPVNPGKMYLCGKGIVHFAPLSTEAMPLLEEIRRKDATRMESMVAQLACLFAEAGVPTGLDALTVRQQVMQRHGCPLETVYLQERHVAQAFQEALFERVPLTERRAFLERLFRSAPQIDPGSAADVQNAIRSYLMKAGRPAYVEETFVGFDHAYQLVLAMGGIPCYPTLADGAPTLCPFEDPVEQLIDVLRARHIYCAEFIPVRNTPEVLTRYVLAMRAAGIVVTAGTEHNTREMLPLVPACAGGVPIPAEVQHIFREGACVVVAHQYLRMREYPGFVDAQGRLDPAYATDEDRIAAYSKLGAAVIARYRR